MAEAGDLEPMVCGAKVESIGDSLSEVDHLIGGEFKNAAALATDHVIVRAVAEGELIVNMFYVEANLFQDSGGHQQRERAVDGGFGNSETPFRHHVQDLIGFEVFGEIENHVEDLLSGRGHFDCVFAEKSAESVA